MHRQELDLLAIKSRGGYQNLFIFVSSLLLLRRNFAEQNTVKVEINTPAKYQKIMKNGAHAPCSDADDPPNQTGNQ